MLNSLNGSKIIAEKFGGYHKKPYLCIGNIAKQPITIYLYVTLHTFTRSKPNY